ncbi:50S ribosomal protein L11 methyltransferase [Chitinasiproducens palmae]|uniref:50S ribosomal protein L11 methyltransferase n=1 Tax=Chitinasiproducens palmae TaxID=1770053 RepID=UPI000B8337CC|nr:50S ribosomal protein L11 methyltransferase [Chitinasiproducens palmae]
MHFNELVALVSRDEGEALSDALLDAGALSVSVEDADADTPDEQPMFGEPGLTPERTAWRHSRVIALFAGDADPLATLDEACAANGLVVPESREIRQVADQDWVRLTQSQFDPIRIGERIWVVPSWHDAPESDALVLELDPGLAFGTGSHPTTRLCMEWLEQTVQAGVDVLDYGCGSGILAILAARCGAGEVVGIDIDPQAVQAARDNASRNRVDAHFGLPEACPDRTYPIVVANILSNPLKVLAAMLCARVAPGGRIALSGVLARQAEEVAAAYAPFIALSVWREHEGWVCLSGVKADERQA